MTDPRLVHIVEKTLDVLVDGRDAAQVVLEILLLGRANAIVATHARDIQVARGVGATVFSLFFNTIFTLWVLFLLN